MKKISKLFNLLSIISCIIAVVLVYVFIIITNSYYLNGYIILMFLCLLLNPITNLFRLNKRKINNPIYHLIIICLTSFISATSISSLKLYYEFLNFSKDNSIALNNAIGCFGERFLYIMIALILTLLLYFVFKKEKIKTDKDNSKLMLIIILITSIIPILTKNIWTMEYISAGFNIALLIFVIIIFFKLRNINTASDLQKYYLILIICSIVSLNPISLFLSGLLFVQLDTFGLHI